jgi:hypothetical protein
MEEGRNENSLFNKSKILFGVMKNSGNRQWEWLHNIINVINATESYT